LRTNAQTLSEVEKAIKSKLKLQENIEFVLHYKENGKLIVFDDIKDLKDGMTIKVSIPSQPNSGCFFFFLFFLKLNKTI